MFQLSLNIPRYGGVAHDRIVVCPDDEGGTALHDLKPGSVTSLNIKRSARERLTKLVELTSSYGDGVLQCGYVQGEAIQNGVRPNISGNTMAQLLQRRLEDNRLRCQY